MPFNGPLWFLQTIFCATIIYSIIHINTSGFTLHLTCILSALTAFVFIKYLPSVKAIIPFGLLRAIEAVFFIHLGYCYKSYIGSEKINRYVILVFSILIYSLGLFFSIRFYDVNGAGWFDAKSYTYNLPLSLITTLGGIATIIYVSIILNKIKLINWLGRNSLVVLCVHFPVQERMNHVCFYFFTDVQVTYMPYKFALVIASYIITLSFSALCIYICKKYLPKFTGYENLIPNNSEQK